MSAHELGRRIDQGGGREPADLVVRNARILNTATGTHRRRRHRDLRRPDRRHPRRPIADGARSTPAGGSSPPASSIPTSISRARWCCRPSSSRASCPRHHHGHLRPARDRQCAGRARHPLLSGGEPEPRHDAAGQSQLLRAGDRAGDRGRQARGRRPAAAARPSGRAWAGRGDELPGRAGQGSGPAGQARRVRRRRTSTATPPCCAGCRSTPIWPPASAPTTSARCSRRRARSWPRAWSC